MWVPLGDVPECSHNVTTHGLSKLSKDLLLTWGTPLFFFFKFLILSYLPSRSQVTHSPMCCVILFLLTTGVLMRWQADEPEKNMTGCSPAVILICLCVCVSYFWCLLVWLHQGLGLWLCPWYSSFPGEGPGTWWAPSKCFLRTPNAQFQKTDEEDRIWVRSTAA